jgi:hypothetical protein
LIPVIAVFMSRAIGLFFDWIDTSSDAWTIAEFCWLFVLANVDAVEFSYSASFERILDTAE